MQSFKWVLVNIGTGNYLPGVIHKKSRRISAAFNLYVFKG